MDLNLNSNYLYYETATVFSSKQPMLQLDACLVATKDYIFIVPKKSIGFYLILTSFKTHRLFDGVSIPDGVKQLFSECKTTEELEKSLINLLENDEKYVHKVSEQTSFKFRGFLGNHSLRMSKGGMQWCGVGPKGRKNSKEFRTFFGH